MVCEEHIPLRFDQWECSWVETKNISFILVSKYKLLLSCEPLPFIFDYLPSAYLIAHNCETTWRFWLSNSVVPTFVRTVKHFDIFHYKHTNPTSHCFKNPHHCPLLFLSFPLFLLFCYIAVGILSFSLLTFSSLSLGYGLLTMVCLELHLSSPICKCPSVLSPHVLYRTCSFLPHE